MANEPSVLPSSRSVAPGLGRRKSILVVDDDVESASLIAHALNRDYDVRLAFGGREGLAAALASPPDLLVTDMSMPEMDGLSMVREMRAVIAEKFPVVFLTARHESSDVIDAIAAGARVFLNKPVHLEQFESAVRRALATPTRRPPR